MGGFGCQWPDVADFNSRSRRGGGQRRVTPRDLIAYIAATRERPPPDPHSSAWPSLIPWDAPAAPRRRYRNRFWRGVRKRRAGVGPDGKRLAVVSQGTDTPSIWIVEPDAPEPTRKLIEFTGGPHIRGIAWDRSGNSILIGKHDMASSDIVLLDSAK